MCGTSDVEVMNVFWLFCMLLDCMAVKCTGYEHTLLLSFAFLLSPRAQ